MTVEQSGMCGRPPECRSASSPPGPSGSLTGSARRGPLGHKVLDAARPLSDQLGVPTTAVAPNSRPRGPGLVCRSAGAAERVLGRASGGSAGPDHRGRAPAVTAQPRFTSSAWAGSRSPRSRRADRAGAEQCGGALHSSGGRWDHGPTVRRVSGRLVIPPGPTACPPDR